MCQREPISQQSYCRQTATGGGGHCLPLDRGADGTVNDELGKHTNGARHTEEDSVVVGLSQAIVLEEHTRVGIDVGVGVLGLAVLGEDLGGDLVDLADQVEHGVLGHLLCGGGQY